jgi:hypothetical protein
MALRGTLAVALIGAVLVMATPGSVQGQVPRTGGMDGMGGRGFGNGPPMNGKVPDPVVQTGPPEAAEFGHIVEASDGQMIEYARLRETFMKETKVWRDSLEAGRGRQGGLGGRLGDGERQAVMNALGKEQKAFDKNLKESLLTKDQWKRYNNWRKQQRKAAEKEMQEQWGGGGWGGGGGGGGGAEPAHPPPRSGLLQPRRSSGRTTPRSSSGPP